MIPTGQTLERTVTNGTKKKRQKFHQVRETLLLNRMYIHAGYLVQMADPVLTRLIAELPPVYNLSPRHPPILHARTQSDGSEKIYPMIPIRSLFVLHSSSHSLTRPRSRRPPS